MATALLTGANGFLGSAVREALVGAGWTVRSAIRRPVRTTDVLLDLEHPGTIEAMPSDIRPDAVIHLAARVGWNGESLDQLIVPNAISTGLLARKAEFWHAHFVYVSAAIVCGSRAGHIDESSPVDADTPYGRSKWLGELLAEAASTSTAVLRIAGIFGLNGPDHLGLNRAIKDALCGKPASVAGAGASRRNYIYVKDAARCILAAAEGRLHGVHLAAGKEVLSFDRIFGAVNDVLLPGQPLARTGECTARDQVVVPSKILPPGRSFREALEDIRDEARVNA